MTRIFISYRRSDTQETAGRIRDQLVRRFGRKRVFTDVDSIVVGEDFLRKIEQEIRVSDVVLIIIGRNWVCTNSRNQPRLDDPSDVVRLEIETALRLDRRIIPVLVQDAVLPVEAVLPEPIRPLLRFNAAHVRSGRDFHPDVRLLENAIDRARGKRRMLILAAVVCLVAALTMFGGALWNRSLPATDATESPKTEAAKTEAPKHESGPPPPLLTYSRGVPMSLDPKNDRRLSELLRTENTEIEFVDTPLKEGLEFMSDLHKVPISIDYIALEKDAIAVDEPINRVVSGLTFHQGLFTFLEPLGLTYVIESGGIKITTLTAANDIFQTRFYDVSDLNARSIRLDELIELIHKSVPEGWDEPPKRPHISRLGPHTLTVFHNVGAHNQIEEFLHGLRASQK